MPSPQTRKSTSPAKSISTPTPRPSAPATRASTFAPFASVSAAPEERAPSPGSAVSLKERVTNRAAAVKKFIGGAAIGGVVRQQAEEYVGRDEADHTSLSQSAGKFAKAFDLQLLESIMHPTEPEDDAPVMVALEEDFEEEKEVWELKTEGIPNPVFSGDKRISRRFSLLPIPQEASASAEEEKEEEEKFRSASLAPLKSALRSRSSSPTASRRHVENSPGGVRFIPGERTPEPSHRAKAVRTDEFFLAVPTISKPSPRGVPSASKKQLLDSKASGVFLKTCGDDSAEESASKSSLGSNSEEELSDTESRALYDEGGEFTHSHIKASVEAMFAFHSYVSPFKAALPPPPPPPPPPPGASHRGSTVTVEAENVSESDQDIDTQSQEEEELLQEEPEDDSDQELNDTFFLTADDEDDAYTAADEFPLQNTQSMDLSGTSPRAIERSASPSKSQGLPAVALPSPTQRQVVAAKEYATAAIEPPDRSTSSPAPPPPVSKFEPPGISVTIPDSILTEQDSSVTADMFLRESNRVLSSTLSQMRSLANSKSLKVRNGSPIVSRRAISRDDTLPESTDLQLNGHGKLDAYEQLIMERMSVAEAVIKLQELEDQSLSRIMKAEEESLRRIQAEAVASVQHVRSVKHRLQRRVANHLENVQTQTKVLSDMRRDLYARQEAAARLQRQRFDEVTQMAASLAEQQLHIAAERRRMAERQFQLQLSLEDLKQCAKSRSRSNSPQRSVYHPYSPAGSYSQNSPRHLGVFGNTFSEERYFSPSSPSYSVRAPLAGFNEQNAPEQYLPSPQQAREPPSPGQFPTVVSPTNSHRSESQHYDKQAPHWYSPVAPLAVRRELTPPSEIPTYAPVAVQEDLTSSQFPTHGGEQTPVSAPPARRARRSSVNYGDGPTNFPNALKAANANSKKAFR